MSFKTVGYADESETSDVRQTESEEAAISRLSSFGTVFTDSSNNRIGESGIVSIDHAGGCISYRGPPFANPVVVARPADFAGSDPTTVRITSLNTEQVCFRLQEWDYLNGYHLAEEVSYLVMEAGHYTLSDGRQVDVGTASVNNFFSTVAFNFGLPTTPVVVTSVQTVNGPAAVTTRLRNIGNFDFQVRLQEEEGADGNHAFETVGYVAWEKGAGTLPADFDGSGSLPYEVGTRASVTEVFSTISFSTMYSDSPCFVADLQTIVGTDPAGLRFRNKTTTGVEVKVEEEQSLDAEVSHVGEQVGYLAFDCRSPNEQSGHKINDISASVTGATICGGGRADLPNQVFNNYGTIGGGYGNLVSGTSGTIAGGTRNSANGFRSTVSGGNSNTASGSGSTVGGGEINTASGDSTTIGGGASNTASGDNSTIGGGSSNTASGAESTVGGGLSNQVLGLRGTVGGGSSNTASSSFSTVAGGVGNTAEGSVSTVGGGGSNTAGGIRATIAGGSENETTGNYAAIGGGSNNTASLSSTVGGGELNTANGEHGTVGGGWSNEASGTRATIAGGYENTASGLYSTVGGGELNTATAGRSMVGGGSGNIASGDYSAVGGGIHNTAEGPQSTVGGGNSNTASGWLSTAGGGGGNTASGVRSTVPGGSGNIAAGDYSFAAGHRAKANHIGTFVWADSTASDLTTTTRDQFLARASGGVKFFSHPTTTAGVSLATGGGSWSTISDRQEKENFEPVDVETILEKLNAMELTTWNYKSQPDEIRHMGPMAQDFYASFGLGEDDKHITTIDADGIALAAIQGLYQKLKEKESRITNLEAEMASIRMLLAEDDE